MTFDTQEKALSNRSPLLYEKLLFNISKENYRCKSTSKKCEPQSQQEQLTVQFLLLGETKKKDQK